MERSRDSARNVPWLDAAKGLALLWIVLNHLVEALAGGAAIGNPDPAWPPFAARLAQLLTPAGHGAGGAF
jgi:peptidoglycan/LPS O-acetylase OafA/YrhL